MPSSKSKENIRGEIIDFTKKYGIPLTLFIIALITYLIINFTPTQSDEYHYFMGAVNIAKNQTYLINGIPAQYPMGYSLLIVLVFTFLGISIKSAVFPCIILGALTVVLLYAFTKELIDKRAALFASLFLIFSHHWQWSIIIMSDVPALFFMLLSLYAAIKYIKTEKPSFIYLFYFATGIACLIRYASGLVFIILGIYLLLSKKMHLLKKKEVWIGVPIFLVFLSPQLIYNSVYLGSPLTTGYDFAASRSPYMPEKLWGLKYFLTSGYGYSPFGLEYIKRLITGFGTPALPFFLFGIWNWIKQRKREELALLIPWIAIPLVTFAFYYRHAERLVIPLLPALLIVSGYGFSKLFDLSIIKNKNTWRVLVASLVILLLIPTVMFRYDKIQGREIRAESRKKTIAWLEENTSENDIILSVWNWYDSYSTKKKLKPVPDSHNELEKLISGKDDVYLVTYDDPKEDFVKRMLDTKQWLAEKFGLIHVKTFETRLTLSLPSRLMHNILKKTGYYSSREKEDQEAKIDRWDIYSITK